MMKELSLPKVSAALTSQAETYRVPYQMHIVSKQKNVSHIDVRELEFY